MGSGVSSTRSKESKRGHINVADDTQIQNANSEEVLAAPERCSDAAAENQKPEKRGDALTFLWDKGANEPPSTLENIADCCLSESSSSSGGEYQYQLPIRSNTLGRDRLARTKSSTSDSLKISTARPRRNSGAKARNSDFSVASRRSLRQRLPNNEYEGAKKPLSLATKTIATGKAPLVEISSDSECDEYASKSTPSTVFVGSSSGAQRNNHEYISYARSIRSIVSPYDTRFKNSILRNNTRSDDVKLSISKCNDGAGRENPVERNNKSCSSNYADETTSTQKYVDYSCSDESSLSGEDGDVYDWLACSAHLPNNAEERNSDSSCSSDDGDVYDWLASDIGSDEGGIGLSSTSSDVRGYECSVTARHSKLSNHVSKKEMKRVENDPLSIKVPSSRFRQRIDHCSNSNTPSSQSPSRSRNTLRGMRVSPTRAICSNISRHITMSVTPKASNLSKNGISLDTVKDTVTVKRKKASLPQQKPNATSGNWLTNRYIINDYILLNELGKGSYAEVRLCKEKTSDRLFAIKIMSKQFLRKKKFMDDVKREVAIMKKLTHENVLRLYEVIDDPKCNKLYLVLEYMKRGDLYSSDALGDCRVWSIARQILRGLSYLHRNSIIHGDIKPQNLLLGEDGRVKIADFGISKMLQGNEKQFETAGELLLTAVNQSCDIRYESRKHVNNINRDYVIHVKGRLLLCHQNYVLALLTMENLLIFTLLVQHYFAFDVVTPLST